MSQKKNSKKLSTVKRCNKLRTKLQKQGKLKTSRNRSKQKKIIRQNQVQMAQNDDCDSSENENISDMIDKDEISYLQKAVVSNSYSFLQNGFLPEKGEKVKSRKRKVEKINDNKFECSYEKTVQQETHLNKKKKYLLPIKTSKGLVARSEEVSSDGDEDDLMVNKIDSKIHLQKPVNVLKEENDGIEEVRNADLLAIRQNILEKKKMRIGILCSGLTENPEQKIHNFKPLIQMLHENDSETCFTAKKLVLVSLQEVFKDILPEYQIKHHNDPSVKLKKNVKQLQTYENDLLKYYKAYLKEIEKMMSVLKWKRGDTRIINQIHITLGELSLKCLCEMLCAHPYFNFSKNIIHLLVPFLNSSRESVREIASSAIKAVFKSDKRGEISLEIVRNINKFVKSKPNIIHCEVLSVMLALNLKDVNLDKEKEIELKKKKNQAKKNKILKMSKREKKRIKKLQTLQKDLLETKAAENKKSREQRLTEITKTIFTIYFRILKKTVSSKLLSAALEGLAKFAHCINIEFYQDLIRVLDNLVQNENLGYKEKLCCVWTVFTILHYQGATIYIDPVKFYSHFYSNILQISAGSNHSDVPFILKTVDFVLLKRRKHVSLQRLLAFTKRLTTLSLQILPNGSLAVLSQIRDILQVNNSTDVLLDTEAVQGQGIYYSELEEPEYCNAGATSLWELLLLQKHYHPTVREFASHLAKMGENGEETTQKKIFFKQGPQQLFEEFDAECMKFNPSIMPPRKFSTTKKINVLRNENLKKQLQTVLNTGNNFFL